MEITIEWQKPVQLTRNGRPVVSWRDLGESLKDRAGVYFFSRKHGSKFAPFYIGKATSIRVRFKQHIASNVKLMEVVNGYGENARKIGHGARYFHVGYLRATKGPSWGKLDIVEKAMLRDALARDYPVLNLHFTKVKTHTIINVGSRASRSIFPTKETVEARG